MVVGIVAVAFNLRPALVSIGPVLAELSAELGMSPIAAGLLTTLPALAFATFGVLAPGLSARVGVHRVTLLSLLAMVTGLALRARAPIFVEEKVIDHAKTVDIAPDRGETERLQKWLESLDPDDMGKYKM